jgi:hypothetical protein
MPACARTLIAVAIWLLLALSAAPRLRAEDAMKAIDNPGGGKIVYGQVEGQTSEAGAMGAMLRAAHQQWGDRPQVGNLFQLRGTDLVAAFFTAVNRRQGDVPLAGLVIAGRVPPDRAEAALLSDVAARIGSTINPMWKTLFGVWHPGGAPPASGMSGPPAAPLHQVSLPDRSASASLPDGWTVVTARSGSGTIIAEGPNGETAQLGFALDAANSNDPQVQQRMRFAQGAGRNTAYARGLYYPYGVDPAKAFVDLLQMWRQQNGLPPASFQIGNAAPVPSGGAARCTHLTGYVDAHEGRGLKEFNSVFCSGPLLPGGQYSNLLYHTAVPVRFADQERATMGAILASYSVNQAVIEQQTNAIAAPGIAAIHEIGRRALQHAADIHTREDIQRQGVEQRWDSRDRRNQAFGNYLLDQTVIQDNQNNAHGTVWNQTADALVRNNPQRFEYVGGPNYWKGIDY